MKKSKLIKIIMAAAVVMAFSGATYFYSDRFFEVARGIDLFTRIYKEVAFTYVDEINPQEFMRAGIRGMLATVDPYTVFIDEKRQEDIDLLTNGKYGGIGVSIGLRDGKVTLLEILDGYSAQKQGLQVGDVIIKVDNVEINEKNFENISSFVKGEPGTSVKLSIQREGSKEPITFDLLREEIKVKSVTYSGFVSDQPAIGYIKLTQFSRPSTEELKNAILDLKKQKQVSGIILDIRNNPGGLLDAAVDISNRFLPKGALIVSTKGRDSMSMKQYFGSQDPLLKDVPVVLLVNENSASASEILAGAIQDHDRGVIIGTKTFGKGLVQTIAPLSYNTSLKITTAKYYTPSGRCIQKINYSKDNKVIANADSLSSKSFLTDNRRTVFSSGGITPDTILNAEETPAIVKDMLAKGVIFKFVNSLAAKAGKEKLSSLKDEYLLDELKNYILKENYTFKTEAEKKVDEVIELTKKDKQFSHLTQKFLDLQGSIRKTSSLDVRDYQTEILEEIRMETAARISGMEGRIRQSLVYDNQYKAAVELLKNSEKYRHFILGK